MPTVQIIIEGDSSDATAAIDQINQRAAALPPTFSNIASASDNATGRMNAGFRESRIVTDLLTGNVQRAEQALVRFGATTSAIGPLIQAAFAPAAIIAFGELAVHTADQIGTLAQKLYGFIDAQKALIEQTQQERDDIAKIVSDESVKLQELANAYNLAGLQGSAKFAEQSRQTAQAMHLEQLTLADLTKQYNDLMAKFRAGSATPIQPGDISALFGIGSQDWVKAKQDADALKVKIDALNATINQQNAEMTNYNHEADLAYGKERQQQVAEMAELTWRVQQRAQGALPVGLYGITPGPVNFAAAREAPASLLDMPGETNEDLNFLATGAARSTQTFKTLDAQMMVNIETDQKVAEEGQKDAQKYAEAWTRARDTMANQLDSFFNELTTGNIGSAFLHQFEKLVSQMVATWLMGVQGIRGSITRSGGLFGDLLGIGGGGGGGFAGPGGGALSGSLGGGAFSLSGLGGSGGFTGADAAMLGLPLSAGGGGGSASLSTLPAGASNVGGAASSALSFGGLLKGIGSLLPIGALAGGSALLGHSGILGAAGSGLLGYGAGAVAGPLLTGLSESLFLSGSIGTGLATTLATVGSFLGPIGAGIGLIAGLIGLFTGNGKVKVQQTQVLQQMERDLNNLQNAFSVHAVDYNSAIGQAEQIRSSYTSQQEQIQQGGGPSRVDPWVNATETYINNLEAQRQNELAAAANFGPAQFSEGGYVHPSMARMVPGFAPAMHFATGGAVPAIVHAGEYVLNAGAVRNAGVARLDAMNNGWGGGDIHIHALDAQSFEQALLNNRVAFVRSLRRMAAEGYL